MTPKEKSVRFARLSIFILLILGSSRVRDRVEQAYGLVDFELFYGTTTTVLLLLVVTFVFVYGWLRKRNAPPVKFQLFMDIFMLVLFYFGPLFLFVNAQSQMAERNSVECKVRSTTERSSLLGFNKSFEMSLENCKPDLFLPSQKVAADFAEKFPPGKAVKVTMRPGFWMPVIESYTAL